MPFWETPKIAKHNTNDKTQSWKPLVTIYELFDIIVFARDGSEKASTQDALNVSAGSEKNESKKTPPHWR